MNPTSRDVHIPSAMGSQPKRNPSTKLRTSPVRKPWSVDNVPPSLKNFTDEEKARFAEVANKVLVQTKDEKRAIAAGLHAVNLMRQKKGAGKSWLAKNHSYKGAMVALFLPDAASKRLAVPDGLEPSELHVTLVYLGEANQIMDPTALMRHVEQFASTQPTLKLKVGGVGQFNQENGEGKRPFYASVDSPDLPGFRQALVESLKVEPDTEHGFTPHVTLKYVPKGVGVNRLVPELEFTVDALSLCLGGVRWDYPLNRMISKARHSKSTCMLCKDRPPTRDILWNHGKSRAWLCDGCFNKWNGEHGASVIRMAYIGGGVAPARHRKVRQSPKISKDITLKVNGETVTLNDLAQSWLLNQKPDPPPKDTITKEWQATIIAKAQDKQLAYGLILRPDVPDSQGDIYNDEEVEKAAHWYAAHSLGKADWLHETELPRGEAVLVESFVSPVGFDWNGFEVKKGDWLGAMWIRDKEKWEAVKKGEIQAFSIKGQGRRMAIG